MSQWNYLQRALLETINEIAYYVTHMKMIMCNKRKPLQAYDGYSELISLVSFINKRPETPMPSTHE